MASFPSAALGTVLHADYVGDRQVGKDAALRRQMPDLYIPSGMLATADGRELWARDPRQRRAMASTTKIMTAVVVLERADLDERVTVSRNAALKVGESGMDIQPGERLTVRQLLEGLMVQSGNDASVALAEHVGGSIYRVMDITTLATIARLGFTQNLELESDIRTLCARLGISARMRPYNLKQHERIYPTIRGEIRFERPDHVNNKNNGEIVAVGKSWAEDFWDIAVDSKSHLFALASGVLTHNSNPMPNFRGVRFTNAHETMIWAQKKKGARYRFNHKATKALNDDLQMRSDWTFPLTGQKERLKVNGSKVPLFDTTRIHAEAAVEYALE